MRWYKLLLDAIKIRRRIRKEVPRASGVDFFTAEPRSEFNETEALRLVPALAKIHSLIANAANRFQFKVQYLDTDLDVESYKFDFYASSALADWITSGYCVFDRDLNYFPLVNLPDVRIDDDKVIVIRNVTSKFQSLQPVLSAAYEFYRILVQVLRNTSANIFASLDAGTVLTRDEADSIRKIFQEKRRLAGAGGVEFISAPMKFSSVSADLASLKLNDIATLLNREICDMFSIDSSLLNDPDNKTYSNKTEAIKSLYTHVLIPSTDRFCEAVTNAFFRNGMHYSFSYDIGSVETLLEDRMNIWNLLKEGYQLGVVSSDELRSFIENMAAKEVKSLKNLPLQDL